MYDTEEFDDEFDEPENESPQIKQLRTRANQARKFERENSTLKAENATLKRQTAFTSAGLNLDEKKQAALLAAHGDGELTADALRATAIELGFAQAQVDEADEQRETALQAQAQIGAAQAGSKPPTAVPQLDEQIRTAEQAGEWSKAMALKAQKVARSIAS